MDQRQLLPPSPTGWYAIALSHELARREVCALQFMGRDVQPPILAEGDGPSSSIGALSKR